MKQRNPPTDLISISTAGVCYGTGGGVVGAMIAGAFVEDALLFVLMALPVAPLFALAGWMIVGLPTTIGLRLLGILTPLTVAASGLVCAILFGIWLWVTSTSELSVVEIAIVTGTVMAGFGAAASVHKKDLPLPGAST